MNKYGAMAQSHWKAWLPNRYARIEDPSSFFSTLGIENSHRIAALELNLAGPEHPGGEFLVRVGQRNMARTQSEETVPRELVLRPAETSAVEDELDELPAAWAIPSAQETVAAVAA